MFDLVPAAQLNQLPPTLSTGLQAMFALVLAAEAGEFLHPLRPKPPGGRARQVHWVGLRDRFRSRFWHRLDDFGGTITNFQNGVILVHVFVLNVIRRVQ